MRQVVVVEDLHRGALDGAVHALGLAVGPRVTRLGQPVFDFDGSADAVEDVRAEVAAARAVAILGQVVEGHAIVGEHGRIGRRGAPAPLAHRLRVQTVAGGKGPAALAAAAYNLVRLPKLLAVPA